MPLTLRYELRKSGWAEAWIGDGETEIGCSVEWEVDSLAELLLEACWHLEGPTERFYRHRPDRRFGWDPDFATYAERGVLFFTWANGQVLLEFDRGPKVAPRPEPGTAAPPTVPRETPLSGWLVWRPTFPQDYAPEEAEERLLLVWSTTVGEFADLVAGIAGDLLARHGFRGYAERWVQFDFPLALYARLLMLRGESTLTIPLG